MTETTEEPVRTGLLIGGEERDAAMGSRIEVRNPARPRELVGWAASASVEDTNAAVEAAVAASPGWAALTYGERASYLHLVVTALGEEVERRIELFVREHGKVRAEAAMELTRLGARFEYTASLADRLAEDQVFHAPPFETIVTRQPMGVAALIIPWNWPLSILGAKLPQALLAGNTVVVKPSSLAPLAPVQTISLMARALPPGVINIVTGSRDTVGAALLSHPAVRKIDLTGGVRSGKEVMAAAAPGLKRLTLELGGNDAGIVLEDADLSESAMRRLALGAFMTSGQVCMALKRLYVQRSIFDDVVTGLHDVLEKYVVGDGLDPASTMGPLVSSAQKARVSGLISEAEDKGARVIQLGAAREADEFAEGHFILPTLVTDCRPDLRVVTEEQFGPVLPILPFGSEDEAVRSANDSPFGLCSSVWSADIERAVALARRLEAGYTYINAHGPTAQDNRAPFGGMKESGIGRQLGLEGVLEFTELHSITISHSSTR